MFGYGAGTNNTTGNFAPAAWNPTPGGSSVSAPAIGFYQNQMPGTSVMGSLMSNPQYMQVLMQWLTQNQNRNFNGNSLQQMTNAQSNNSAYPFMDVFNQTMNPGGGQAYTPQTQVSHPMQVYTPQNWENSGTPQQAALPPPQEATPPNIPFHGYSNPIPYTPGQSTGNVPVF